MYGNVLKRHCICHSMSSITINILNFVFYRIAIEMNWRPIHVIPIVSILIIGCVDLASADGRAKLWSVDDFPAYDIPCGEYSPCKGNTHYCFNKFTGACAECVCTGHAQDERCTNQCRCKLRYIYHKYLSQ